MPERGFAAYCEPGSRRDGRGSVMSPQTAALGWAEARVMAVRDNPAARLALMARLFRGPTGRAARHLPFRRAPLSFMRWQTNRGLSIGSMLRPRAACGGVR